jgi:type IV secretory pathway TrbD component
MLKLLSPKHLRGSLLLAGGAGFVQLVVGSLESAVVVAVLAWLMYFAALALHEVGHFAVARVFGAQPKFLGSSVVSVPGTRLQSVIISAAGPVAGSTVPALLLPAHSLPGLTFTGVVLIANHLAMLLPVFPDGRIIFSNLNKDITNE